MAISKIQKASISDEVYDQILHNIVSKEWKPCSKLPSEIELAQMLGVSRISVRNAVQRLVGQGILESRHGEGTFVSDLSLERCFNSMVPLLTIKEEQICEMYEFRRVLETGNIRLLAESMTEEHIGMLEQNYEVMKQTLDDIEKFTKIDIEFHCIIAQSIGNTIITNMYKIIREALYPYQMMVQTTFGTKGALKYHKLILDALKKRDFSEAEHYMDEHMAMTIKNVKTKRQNIN